jgi:hypothetical protein
MTFGTTLVYPYTPLSFLSILNHLQFIILLLLTACYETRNHYHDQDNYQHYQPQVILCHFTS